MKLRDKLGVAKFFVTDPVTNKTSEIDQSKLLNPRQRQKISCRPELLHMFAYRVADLYESKFNKKPKVTAEAICSLNYRPFQHMIKPDYNLLETPLWYIHS
jgi:vitamin K-dependent gamma-carboxylase